MKINQEVALIGESQKVKVLFESSFLHMKCFIRLTKNIIISIAEEGMNKERFNIIYFWKKGNNETYEFIGTMDVNEREEGGTVWGVQPEPPENPDITEESKRISCVQLGVAIATFLTD